MCFAFFSVPRGASKIFGLAFLLSFALLVFGQDVQVEVDRPAQVVPAPNQESPAQPGAAPALSANEASTDNNKFSLSGTVVNSVTGEPIRRALVQMNGRVEASVLTDFEGAFRFEGLSEGPAYLTARKPGFFTEQELNSDPNPPPSVEVGPNTSSVALKLIPEGSISGRVVGADGQPVEDLPVAVYVQRIMDGTKHRVQQNRSLTDADGHFKIANLQPGTYYVSAGPGTGLPRRRRQLPASRDEGYPQLFYPASTELSSAAPVNVAAGQDSEADLSMKTEQMFRVSGTVAGFAPGMSMGMQFRSKSGEYVQVRHFLNNRTGDFRAQLLAGSYRLHVSAQSEGQALTADVPVTVTSDLADLPVVLSPTIDIPVVIRTDGSASGSNSQFGGLAPNDGNPRLARIRASYQQSATVRLTTGDTFAGGRDFWSSPGDDPKNPGLAIRNVEPGTYSVDIAANGPSYVQSATCGETDLLRDELHVNPGAHLPPIQVTLKSDPGTLTGSLQLAGHPSRGGVILIPDRGGVGKVQWTTAGPDGEFQFSMLAPGDYRVLAFDHLDRLEYRNPEVLEPYLSRAVRVSVQPSEPAKTNVELIVTGQ